MKIVYVLVCSEKDYYGEQALISMMSAKHHMPNCIISLLLDKTTNQNIANSKIPIDDYISEKKIIDLDGTLSPTQKSRWLKTSMRELVKGDFLYVDVDTVFAGPINESLFTEDVMGVPDSNMPLHLHPMREFIEKNLNALSFENSLDYHINGGVLYFKDTPAAHSFAESWHKRWKESCNKGIFIDQPALHQAIIDTGKNLTLLPDYMNAQFCRNINTLANGVILHYYSSWLNDSVYIPAYKFLQKDWLQKFRSDPKSEIFQKDIYNPKEAFDPNTFVLGRHFNSFWNTQLVQYLMNLWISSDRADKRLFRITEMLALKIKVFYYELIKFLHPIFKGRKKSNLFVVIIILPLVLMGLEPLTDINFKGRLSGYFDTPQKKTFSIASYGNREYQKSFESWFNANVPLRGYFIRLYNQIHFSLFHLAPNGIVGKRGDLFEIEYIRAECGLTSKFDFDNQENYQKLENYVNHLISIQNKLDSIGKKFIFLITPSKAAINFEDIPLKYRLKKRDDFKSPYNHLKKILSRKKINYIDSRDYLSKDSVPNFYTTGIHWARPLEQRVSQAVVNKMSELTNLNFPRINLYKLIKRSKPFKRDADIFSNANTIYRPNMVYYEYGAKFEQDQNFQEPVFMIQGGSFSEGLYSFDYANYSKKTYKFWYNKVYREGFNPKIPITKWEDVDFTKILDNINIVIIETNEAYIPYFNDGFVEYLDSFLDSYKSKSLPN